MSRLPPLLIVLSTCLCLGLVAAETERALREQRWGLPDGGQLARPEPYGIACFDGRLRSDRYVLELLTAASVSAGRGDRDRSHFHHDRRWPSEFQATLADYRAISKEHDRGHLAAALYHGSSQQEMDATHCLSNVSPMDARLNRGLWRILEEHLRDAALSDDVARIWVATFPLWMPDDAPDQGETTHMEIRYRVAGPNHIPIPTHYGKAALFESRQHEIALRAWCVPNRPPPAGRSPDQFRVPTDYVEHWSGLDFWADLPDKLELPLEGMK